MSIAWLTDPPMGLAEPSALKGSESDTFDAKKQTATVDLICPWDDRYPVLFNILFAQKEWPYLPGSDIRAMTGSTTAFDGSKNIDNGSANDYVDAKVTINFEWSKVKANAPGGGTAIYSESLDPTAEFLTVPYQDFRWTNPTGDALKKEEAPGRLEIGLDYTVTWNGLIAIPNLALTLIGCVNNATVTSPSLGLSFGAETLLFNPPKITRAVSGTGEDKFQMITRCTFRQMGWNAFWRAKTATFERMYHKDGGGAPYNNFKLAAMGGILP